MCYSTSIHLVADLNNREQNKIHVEVCLLFIMMGETKRPTDLGIRARAPGSKRNHCISWFSAGCARRFSQTSIWHGLPMNEKSCRVFDEWSFISSISGPDPQRMRKQRSGQTKRGKSRGCQTPGRASGGPGHAGSGGCLDDCAGASAEVCKQAGEVESKQAFLSLDGHRSDMKHFLAAC